MILRSHLKRCYECNKLWPKSMFYTFSNSSQRFRSNDETIDSYCGPCRRKRSGKQHDKDKIEVSTRSKFNRKTDKQNERARELLINK